MDRSGAEDAIGRRLGLHTKQKGPDDSRGFFCESRVEILP